MCLSCYESTGAPTVINAATRNAAELIRKVYEFSSAGGNAHIVVDDWNLEDENIQWCLDVAIENNIVHANNEQLTAERACLEALLALTPDERASALAIHDGFISD